MHAAECSPAAQVTQVQFRLPSGRETIARRFWLKDRVSLLFQFVRTTVRDVSTAGVSLLTSVYADHGKMCTYGLARLECWWLNQRE